MLPLAEMQLDLPIVLYEKVMSTTRKVWTMLDATKRGDLELIRQLVGNCPQLLTCQYDYTTPIHFAVREGNLELVRFLLSRGALKYPYATHPFGDSLITFASDRGRPDIADLLESALGELDPCCPVDDVGQIDYQQTEEQLRFQNLVDTNLHAEVESMVKRNSALALNELAFWGEGILAMPAKDNDLLMIELLMSYGAKVPELSKWGARYYFKHIETARYLLHHGMNPDQMNWRRFTLLHDMAFTGELEKAKLLLDHGANINAIDDDYQSTPLGYAAHWGKTEVARLLLERGANPTLSGAPWATPLEWAKRYDHREIIDLLRSHG